MVRHQRFLDLLSLLPTLLEKNVTEQNLVDFKRSVVSELKTLKSKLTIVLTYDKVFLLSKLTIEFLK